MMSSQGMFGILMFCLFCLISSMGNYFFMMLSLEAILMMVFFIILTVLMLLSPGMMSSLMLLFLVMMVFEGVFGLCLLVKMSRSEGEDFYNVW